MKQTQTRTLRIIQICMIVYVLLLFWLIHILPAESGQAAMTPVKWGITLAAFYCVFGGFSIQKKMLRNPANPRASSKSTPAGRWMIGNVVRLAFAVAVSLYGLLLHFLGGPDSLAASLIGLVLILLLVWKPGSLPVQEQ